MSRGRVSNIEDNYFRWLCGEVGMQIDGSPEVSYSLIMSYMHQQPFLYTVPNDDNRAADGRQLRDTFCDETGTWGTSRYIFEPCSFLEMLVALSGRAAYETEDIYPNDQTIDPQTYWFWELFTNMGLEPYTDSECMEYGGLPDMARLCVSCVNERDYSRDGGGSLFPLTGLSIPYGLPDRREVELFYQLSDYIRFRNII